MAEKAKGKQSRLPGKDFEPIMEIENAMEKYREIRDDRMRLTAREIEANLELVKVMDAHKQKTYTSPDGKGKAEIIIEKKIKAKVSSVKTEGDDPEE